MSTQDAESPCPLNNSEGNRDDRYNPANLETATCYLDLENLLEKIPHSRRWELD